MSTTVIKVENLSKLYRLGEIGTGSLAHDVNRWWHLVRGKEDPYLKIGQVNDRTTKAEGGKRKAETSTESPSSLNSNPSTSTSGPGADYVYALKDVSFEVKQGEVLGIIGRNGAGKSTLLKILSRVTKQTTGRIRVKGRIASLLEVGTGFHPELTGRENIFLNGAILGMRKAEIKAKFDEIVDFSGVERYIDTPVKRYSSGMYVRLAFAVAAHLEPEILIVDEVLAVGDAEFQKKCLGKMKDVAGHGRTILFVSHNMAAIRSLCSSAIWIDCGTIRDSGETPAVLENYLRSSVHISGVAETLRLDDPAKEFQVVEARMVKPDGTVSSHFLCDDEVCIELVCQVRTQIPGLYGYLLISRRDGTAVVESDSFDGGDNQFDNLSPGLHKFRITLPARSLGPGEYTAYFNFASPMNHAGFVVDSPGELLAFQLDDPNSRRGNRRGGFLSTLLPWNMVTCSTRSPALREFSLPDTDSQID